MEVAAYVLCGAVICCLIPLAVAIWLDDDCSYQDDDYEAWA